MDFKKYEVYQKVNWKESLVIITVITLVVGSIISIIGFFLDYPQIYQSNWFWWVLGSIFGQLIWLPILSIGKIIKEVRSMRRIFSTVWDKFDRKEMREMASEVQDNIPKFFSPTKMSMVFHLNMAGYKIKVLRIISDWRMDFREGFHVRTEGLEFLLLTKFEKRNGKYILSKSEIEEEAASEKLVEAMKVFKWDAILDKLKTMGWKPVTLKMSYRNKQIIKYCLEKNDYILIYELEEMDSL